ncbi:hypothetical protein [Streptomyces sp. NPDC002205]|uniref:hypothetical protein n=1 Tax=Streptomyces sp. NPDC002205 TaxID=3154411 RepID=UPI00332DF68C
MTVSGDNELPWGSPKPIPQGAFVYGKIAPGTVPVTQMPDGITEEPEMLRRILVLAVRDGLGVNEQTAEHYLAAHERHQAAANR